MTRVGSQRHRKKINFYMFRALLVIRRYYSVYTAVGAMLLCWLAVGRILPTARQHESMTHPKCCIYRQALRDDEQ
jgi:hypothetical protein